MKPSPIILLACLSLTGCEYILSNMPGIYHINVDQGNKLDQSMVDQLRPSMSKRQVLFIMGSPMLGDIYHDSRWTYLYSAQEGGSDRLQKRVTLIFNGETLVGMQGDFRPSSLPVEKPSTTNTVDLPKRELDRSMWEKITGVFADPFLTQEDEDAKPKDDGVTLDNNEIKPQDGNVIKK
jgi:outer membrane protein assembly factor BamE